VRLNFFDIAYPCIEVILIIPYNEKQVISDYNECVPCYKGGYKIEKITIIEDDTDIRNMITKFLINQKYEVYSAPNGKEGIELCQRFLPDLIILDLMLPVLSGDNVLN